MSKHKSNFKILVVIIIVLLLIVFGLIGVLIYKINSKNPNNISSDSTNNAVIVYTSWNSLPSDIKNADLTVWNKLSPGYKTDPVSWCNLNTIKEDVSDYNPIFVENDKFAIFGAGCDSGLENILEKDDNNWTILASTDFGVSCSFLTKYNIPKNLYITSQITDSNGSKVQCLGVNGNFQNIN